MLNYMSAELNRVKSNKGVLLYFLICFIAYSLLVFIRLSSLTSDSIASEAVSVFQFLFPLFVGTMLFSVVYNNDLTAKTLPQVVGFGLSRKTIVLAKSMVMVIVTLITYLLGFILFHALFFLIGLNTMDIVVKTFSILVNPFLIVIGYSLLASTVVYGTQRATMAIVTFIVFITSIVPQLIGAFLGTSLVQNIVGDLTPYLLSSVINNISQNLIAGQFDFMPWITLAVYLTLFTVTAIIVFNKKELEF